MNTMEIIKLFPVNIFFLAWQFCYFAKRSHFGFLVSSGGFSKKPTAKSGYFALGKKGGEKTGMVKVAKSCHQVTWEQKSMTKKRKRAE